MSSEKDSSAAARINGHVLIIVMVSANSRPSAEKLDIRTTQQGVSGSGKSTLGAALAKALGCPFVDADDLHPQTNVEKMSRGEPLTDADRAPWLVNVRKTALKVAESDSHDDTAGVVVACSALKIRYREVLRGKVAEPDLFDPVVGCGASDSGFGNAHVEGKQDVQRGSTAPSTWRTFFVHPDGPREVLLERMMKRNSHFMKANMLASQLESLESPSGTGEINVVGIELISRVEEQVERALEGLAGAGACEI